MLEICDLLGDISDADNAEVIWLLNFAETNLAWKKRNYKRYNNFLKALNSSDRVREMIKQHHSAQQRKTWARKMEGNQWQHYPKLQEILGDSSGSEKWLQLTAIANQTSRDPELAKRWLNRAYVNRLTKQHRKSKANRWYISGVFQEPEMLLDNGCPQLEDGIDYKAMGLKWYQGLVMPLGFYPGMDDRDHANQLHTISPSVPPADHEMPIPPPSPNKSKMLPPPTPPTKGKEKEMDESNIGGRLMDLAENGSEDGTNTPTKKEASAIPPAPTEEEADTISPAATETEANNIPPAPTEKDTGSILPAPTKKEAGTIPTTPIKTEPSMIPPTGSTPEKPPDLKHKAAQKPDWPATPSSRSWNSNGNTEDKEYVSWFLEWLGLDLDCKRMLDDQIKMWAHHERQMVNKAIPILQQAVNEDHELCIEDRAQITAVVYVMREVIVRFSTPLGIILYFARG